MGSQTYKPDTKLRLLRAMSADKVAASFRGPLQVRWDPKVKVLRNPAAPEGDAAQQILDEEDERILDATQRHGAVLAYVKKTLGVLLPDDEAKCRDIFDLIPWPVDFAPILTFEAVFVGKVFLEPRDERFKRLLEDLSTDKIVTALKEPLQVAWEAALCLGSGLPFDVSEQARYERVLKQVKNLGLLLPEHEAKAREVFALIEWPVKRWAHATTDFAPIPTFEAVFGGTCKTCGGGGVAGFLFGIACPDC